MNEATKRRWDVWLGIVAPVLTVIGILVGVRQFNAGEENRRELQQKAMVHKDDMDFRRKLWLERLNAYRSVAELSGKIIAQADGEKFKDAVRDLTATYWGAMILVEDAAVEEAMVNFYFALQDFKDGWRTLDQLKIRADQLIKACRRSLEEQRPDPVLEQVRAERSLRATADETLARDRTASSP